MHERMKLDKEQTDALMKKCDILGVAIAFVDSDGIITPDSLGVTNPWAEYNLTLKDIKNDTRNEGLKLNTVYIGEKDGKLTYSLIGLNGEVRDQILDVDAPKGELTLEKVSSLRNSILKSISKSGNIPSISPVDANTTIFGAASLTKPIFAYLVLKLIKSGDYQFNLKSNLNAIYSFEEFCKENDSEWERKDSDAWVKSLNAEMVLSHTTGLDDKTLHFKFEPGTEYRYAGMPILYLQKVIEKHTGKSLEELAQKYLFGPNIKHSSFNPEYDLMIYEVKDRKPGNIYLKDTEAGLQYEVINQDGELKKNIIPWNGLPKDFQKISAVDLIQEKEKFLPILLAHTSAAKLTPPANAANSLRTTAVDFANLIKDWMNDKDLQYAFKPAVHMVKDHKINDEWAHAQKISEDTLKHIACGLGWELEEDNQGNIKAYKTGDMNQWRAQVAIDLNKKTAIVFLANSPDGHILADQIISPNIKLKHGFNYFFQKWGFARKLEYHWRDKQLDRVCEIIVKNELDLADLQKKNLLIIDNNKPLHTLTITCKPDYFMLNRTVKNKFDALAEKNPDALYSIKDSKDKKGNIILEIGIHNDKLYNQFIDYLYTEKFLPAEVTATQTSLHKTPTLTRNPDRK